MSDAAKNWSLEPTAMRFRLDLPANSELWSAVHLPTGNRIFMVFDEYGYMLSARKHETCPHDLLSEAIGLFGDYLKDAPTAQHHDARKHFNHALS